jgi:hypothetical protein
MAMTRTTTRAPLRGLMVASIQPNHSRPHRRNAGGAFCCKSFSAPVMGRTKAPVRVSLMNSGPDLPDSSFPCYPFGGVLQDAAPRASEAGPPPKGSSLTATRKGRRDTAVNTGFASVRPRSCRHSWMLRRDVRALSRRAAVFLIATSRLPARPLPANECRPRVGAFIAKAKAAVHRGGTRRHGTNNRRVRHVTTGYPPLLSSTEHCRSCAFSTRSRGSHVLRVPRRNCTWRNPQRRCRSRS